MARCLFGADTERLLLTGEFVSQMRGHNIKDGTRTAVVVQVHPDLRVQALVEQIREREVEQMVGRLRLVHRTTPARVFLLSNLPTALPRRSARDLGAASYRASWSRRSSPAGACCRCPMPSWRGRTPACGPHPREAEHWMARKGTQVPIRELYWNVGTLSVATLVSYRRPGHRRGSPHQAILPGRVECTELAEELLAAVVGEVEQIRILDVIAAARGLRGARRTSCPSRL